MKKIKGLLVLVFGLIMAFPLQVNAQDSSSVGAISISPTRFEFVVDRGQAELATIFVENVSDKDMVARAFINDFEPDGNTGNPNLLVDNEVQSSFSIKEFVVGLTDVTIPAGETEKVNVPIQIPENAAPGAYYGAIRFQSTPVGEDGTEPTGAQLSLNASVAAIVLIEVPGDITEKIEISNISAYLDDSKGTLFTKKPNKVGIEVNNLGNGFSKPFGQVEVNGPWGTGRVSSYEINNTSPRGNVLPKSLRLFKDDLNGVKWPGRYTVIANISHGSGGEILTATTSFWYLPSWAIVSILVLVLLLVGVSFFLYRKHVTKSMRRRH